MLWTIAKKVKIKGLITGRTGDARIVKTADASVTLVLTDDTKVQKPKGLGLRKTQMSFTALIPGIKVSVEGVQDEKGQLVADVINFFWGGFEGGSSHSSGPLTI